MSESVPLLFDTDIGSDIDDAVALAYLLQEPRCELLGITTVTGDVAKRAALAQMLCTAAGRNDIPIHAGATDVLLHGPGQPDVPQYEPVRDRPHRLDWPPNTAIEFMRRAVRERPGEVTLLSVGPLTNVALLFATDPEVPRLLRAWVSMAGVFGPCERPVDWNAVCDPVATAISFRAAAPEHVHVGLDITSRCGMTASDIMRRWRGPLPELVLRMAEAWFERRGDIVFHDPLAAAVVFEPQLCSFERGTVEVDARTAVTSFTPDVFGRDLVARSVDVEAFFDVFYARFA